jgi:acyl carrier protein
MTQNEILSRMQVLFDDLFLEPVKLAPELSAREVDEWDSLMQISVLVAVEKEFGIRFRVGEVEGTQNVGQFADLIATRLDSK